jgi:hypothetical protein
MQQFVIDHLECIDLGKFELVCLAAPQVWAIAAKAPSENRRKFEAV